MILIQELRIVPNASTSSQLWFPNFNIERQRTWSIATIEEITLQVYNTPACLYYFFMRSAEGSYSFSPSVTPDVVSGPVIRNMFNGALINCSRNPNDAVFLGRETPQENALWGVADTTAICHRRIQISSGQLITNPRETPRILMPGKTNFEDFRTYNNAGETTIGMTVVESGNPIPGYMKVERRRDQSYYTKPQVLGFAEGKNFTPIGPFKTYKDAFLFRPEGEINNHVLQIWGLDTEGKPHFIQDLSFEQSKNGIPAWGAYRMGTTGGDQFFQSENEMVMLVHGMTKEIRGEQNDRYDFYRYSIGAAKIVMSDKGWLTVTFVSPFPLITPDHMKKFGEERSRQREVVYACGLVPVDSGLWVLVNKGDKLTVPIFLSHEKIKNSFLDKPLLPSAILYNRTAA